VNYFPSLGRFDSSGPKIFLRAELKQDRAGVLGEAYIAKVQEWLGHANIATTRIYDHRNTG
jgi:integrase